MKLSDAEWQIMNVLWEKYPATARELLNRLPEHIDWAYTTIKTMLARLVVKNVVSEKKSGNTSYYEPLLEQKDARKSALSSIFDRVLNGTLEPLAHYLIEDRKISGAEREELIRLLKSMDQSENEK